MVPCSIRASRHDYDKLRHPHRMVAFSLLKLKTPPGIRRLSNNAPHNVQQTTAEESKWSGTHCWSRTNSSRRVFYVAPAIWMWLGPFLLVGGASGALATRFRAAPSPYALPVNARPRDRPHRALLKSYHRSFGMRPLVVPATAEASAPTSRIILDIVISRTVGELVQRISRNAVPEVIATAVHALRRNKLPRISPALGTGVDVYLYAWDHLEVVMRHLVGTGAPNISVFPGDQEARFAKPRNES
jgi:hypothetical protein